jgi:hypothetical protein
MQRHYIEVVMDLLLSVCEIQRRTSNILGALDTYTALTPYLEETPIEPERDSLGSIWVNIKEAINIANELTPESIKGLSSAAADQADLIPPMLESMEIEARYAKDYYHHAESRLQRIAGDSRQIIKWLTDLIRDSTDTAKETGRAAKSDIKEAWASNLDYSAVFKREDLEKAALRLNDRQHLNTILAALTLSKKETVDLLNQKSAAAYSEWMLECADSLDDTADQLHKLANTARGRLYVAIASLK